MTTADRHDAAAGRGGLYRRLFAWGLSRFGAEHDEVLAERKQALLGKLEGTVVEIGPGTGVNLRYLEAASRYIGVEPNLHMHTYLEETASRHRIDTELRVGTAERLPLADATADALVSTLVLCSVDDVAAVLQEIRRVLRPGGKFIFVEHVAAAAGTRLRWWQGAVEPAWRRLGDGCRPDRDLAGQIGAAGFSEVQIERFVADISLALVRPHIAGAAVK